MIQQTIHTLYYKEVIKRSLLSPMRRSVSTLIQLQHRKKRKNCETSRSVAKRLIWTKRPLGCTITCLQPSMYSLTLFSPFRRDKAGCATCLEQSPLQDSDSLIMKPHINSFSKMNRWKMITYGDYVRICKMCPLVCFRQWRE